MVQKKILTAHRTNHHCYLITELFLSWRFFFFFRAWTITIFTSFDILERFIQILTWDINIFISFDDLERFLHILLTSMTLSIISQSFAFQVSDNQANPLVTTHQSVNNHSVYFPLQTKFMTMHTAWSPGHYEYFLWLVTLKTIVGRGCNAAVLHIWVMPG